MSNFLSRILSNDHPLFTRTIAEFERASGNSGVDTKLIGDITQRAHAAMRSIGVDPADTSAEELYHALNSTVERGNLLAFADLQYVLLPFDDGPISFNLLDVIDNQHHELEFSQRTVGHAQRHLRLEIVKRYADHDRTSNDLVHNLASQSGLKHEYDEHFSHADQLLLTAGTMMSDSTTKATSNVPRILSIGDIFTDAFIRLNEDVARIEEDENGEKRISLPFGSKPPYDGVDIVKAVGPAPNAAVAIARLGLQSELDSFIGDDEVGREAIEYLHTQNVDTDAMLIEKGLKTSYYFVLRYGAERTILVKNEQFEYTWEPPKVTPDWIYLALISDASWQYHESLANYLDENPQIKLAFQPGTFHFKWGAEKLRRIYARSYIVVMNREEAVDVTGASYDDLKSLTKSLHDLGPEIVVITDGPNGSYASFDSKLVTIPNYPDPGPPVDRTGAGDAFASTIVSALAQGESMETALTWAPINSMNVVQNLGAQAGLLTRKDIDAFLESAPDTYVVSEVE